MVLIGSDMYPCVEFVGELERSEKLVPHSLPVCNCGAAVIGHGCYSSIMSKNAVLPLNQQSFFPLISYLSLICLVILKWDWYFHLLNVSFSNCYEASPWSFRAELLLLSFQLKKQFAFAACAPYLLVKLTLLKSFAVPLAVCFDWRISLLQSHLKYLRLWCLE